MNKTRIRAGVVTIGVLLAGLAMAPRVRAAEASGFGLDVLVDGSGRPEYHARGTVYVEAVRGREYALRISNPTGYRVAVALSVDGLNTIDARHTDARNAAKWVLGPYESAVITGWQVSDNAARRFFFTGEKRSYGARSDRRPTSASSRRSSSAKCGRASTSHGNAEAWTRRLRVRKRRGKTRPDPTRSRRRHSPTTVPPRGWATARGMKCRPSTSISSPLPPRPSVCATSSARSSCG